MNDLLVAETPPTDQEAFTPTILADNSLITSAMSVICPQSVIIEFQELEPYLAEYRRRIGNLKGVEQLREAALLTIETLKAGEAKWAEILRQEQDTNYTLGRCIREQVNTCFHRAIFFNWLMQQTGIKSQIIEGRWLETDRNDLTENPLGLELEFMLPNRVKFLTGESSGEHLWNIVRIDRQPYLVDTSYLLAGDNQKPQPVIHKITDQSQTQVKLPIENKPTRHYIQEDRL